ncbi:MAG: hypothetical protein P4L67_02175 [Candidatus Pacebacteria bacterium]|nr:hypothetical protein [Candidatus Paceibacterota bacterium]
MVEFIFSTILMLCLGTVLYLTVRALPRIEEAPAGEGEVPKNLFERWAHSELPEKIDAAFSGFMLKFLRRVKIIVLRIDNAIAKGLRKVQPQENRANTSIDFKEISGQNTEDVERKDADGGDKK